MKSVSVGEIVRFVVRFLLRQASGNIDIEQTIQRMGTKNIPLAESHSICFILTEVVPVDEVFERRMLS